MLKAMLFIDGTWLYSNTPRLAETYRNRDFRLNFGKLPKVLVEEVADQVAPAEIDLVRTYLFGSYAMNYDLRDDEAVQRRRDFFSMLKEEYHYEVETYPINFLGRRLRRVDRDPEDTFEPKEKCVDISLAACMLYYAAIPHTYDIAITVIGDRDFKPVLQYVRRLGKRAAIASIKGSCSPELADPRDEARVKDFDIIWLDDLLDRLELKYEPHQLLCESPMHKGRREVWTTFYPRKGQRFFCEECQEEFRRQKQEAQREFLSAQVEVNGDAGSSGPTAVAHLSGVVKKKLANRGFGFIHASDGHDYFFHLTDLDGSLGFDDVMEGLAVTFEVKTQPGRGEAGAARNVRRHEEPAASGQWSAANHSELGAASR